MIKPCIKQMQGSFIIEMSPCDNHNNPIDLPQIPVQTTVSPISIH
jgi:hypothetical protein